jgi:type VI secretion system protein VasJ
MADKAWHWSIYGKHPSAKDFVSVGQNNSMAHGYSEWMEQGYKKLISKNNRTGYQVFFRFWSRSPGRDMLTCGIIRDSSDTLGREFPLMIIGSGFLNGWEENIDCLPIACEKIWKRAEYIASNRYIDFKVMESDINHINSPKAEWEDVKKQKSELNKSSEKNNESGQIDSFDKIISSGVDQKHGYIVLKNDDEDSLLTISQVHLLLKKNNKGIVPGSVFMGGTVACTYLAYFYRPVGIDDFVNMWLYSISGVNRNGPVVTG